MANREYLLEDTPKRAVVDPEAADYIALYDLSRGGEVQGYTELSTVLENLDVVTGPADDTSTDNAIVRWDGTTGDVIQNNTRWIIDDNGSELFWASAIGSQSRVADYFNGTTAALQIHFNQDSTDVSSGLSVSCYGTNPAKGAGIYLRRQAGTYATPVTVAQGDILGDINWVSWADSGYSYLRSGYIQGIVSTQQSLSANAVPTEIQVYTGRNDSGPTLAGKFTPLRQFIVGDSSGFPNDTNVKIATNEGGIQLGHDSGGGFKILPVASGGAEFWVHTGALDNETYTSAGSVNASGAWTITPGTIDHGLLSGLGDDDHTQYVLHDGTRTFSYAGQADYDLWYSSSAALGVLAIGADGTYLGVSSGTLAWSSVATGAQYYEADATAGTDPTATGSYALAIGEGADAYADNGIAIGKDSAAASAAQYSITIGTSSAVTTSSIRAVAIGYNAKASGTGAIAIGDTAGGTLMGGSAIAIGDGSVIQGSAASCIAIGGNHTISQNNAIRIGYGGGAASYAVSIGSGSSTLGAYSINIGGGQLTTSEYNVCIGLNYFSVGEGCSLVGHNISTNGSATYAVGLGYGASISSSAALRAIVIGYSASALALSSIAIGDAAACAGTTAIAIGDAVSVPSGSDNAIAIGTSAATTTAAVRSVAIGYNALARNIGSIAIGDSAQTTTAFSQNMAIGDGASANNAASNRAIAIGPGAAANGQETISIGDASSVAGQGGIAIGNAAVSSQSAAVGTITIGDGADTNNAAALRAIAIGYTATATALGAVAIGDAAASSQTGGIAIGDGSATSAASAVAIGVGVVNTTANRIQLGTSTEHVYVYDLRVADGTDTDDATFYHDGSNFITSVANTDNWLISGFTPGGGVQLRNGAYLYILDSSNANYSYFTHDGTDFNLIGVSTTDLNITGVTSITIPGQIGFPASQSASSDANTLDDYEEGTFTPTILGSTSNPTQSYGTRAGYYTKVGRHVFITGYVAMAAAGITTGSGNAQLSGLPFTTTSDSVAYGGGSVGHCGSWNVASVGHPNQVYTQMGTTYAYITRDQDTGGTGVQWNQASQVQNSTNMAFEIQHYV